MSTPYDRRLEEVTRISGVRGALLAIREDGLTVAEALMDGVDGPAVAALVASLWTRVGSASAAAGRSEPGFLQLEADTGNVLAVPAGSELLLVAVTQADANLGLARLELFAAARDLA